MQGARWILALVTALALMACGGSEKKYMLPVDSPAKPFVPPEADELVESDEGGWDLDEEEADEGDEVDDAANTASEPPAATTPKPTPGTATPPVAPTKPKKPAKSTVTKPAKP